MFDLKQTSIQCCLTAVLAIGAQSVHAADSAVSSTTDNVMSVPAPTAEDQVWRLPATPPSPVGNELTEERIQLGRNLFFDPRLSGSKNTACATCHNPSLGWSDGRKTAAGVGGKVLGRASPSVENLAYNTIFMWDGRKHSLEAQALGPMESTDEMGSDFNEMMNFLQQSEGYKKLFEKAYPGEKIGKDTIGKAIASFERTLTIQQTPFDQWLGGDKTAITNAQWRGYQIFKKQGNCSSCHSAPNFTDNGFHNVGLQQQADKTTDVGRFAIRKVAVNMGAFKTPPLRNVEYTAPYFHDGSASTLEQVIEHYAKGGVSQPNLSSNIHKLNLTTENKADLLAFLKSLSAKPQAVPVPILPQ